MRNGILGSLTLLLAGVGPALAQAPYPYPVYPQPAPPGWYPVPPQGPYPPQAVYGTQPGAPAPAVAAKWQGGQQAPAAPASHRKRSKMVGWPPPVQVLPDQNPPPPEFLAETPALSAADPSSCPPAAEACPAPSEPRVHIPTRAPRGYRWYGTNEYLLWWVRDADIPPLAATGPLGSPGSSVLLDDSDTFDNQQRHGARLTLGRWLNPGQTAGLEATYLWLANRTPSFRTSGSGDPLGVPFIDSATGLESLEAVSGAGQGGRIDIDTEFAFWAAEANLRKELCRGSCYHLDLLAGSRFLSLQEGLDVTTSTTFTDGASAGSSLSRSDRFGTRNSIWGGQVGAEFEVNYKRLFADVWGKVLLGYNHQVVNVGGTSLLTGPARGTQAAVGGLFAQRSNIGHNNREEFVVVPEAGVNVGYCLTDWLRFTAGYNFLFISDAVRPGDQIDRTVNTGFQLSASGGATPDLGGGPRPAFSFRDTEFWAHGLSVGLEFRY